jgi:hypothetical protein
MERVYWEIRTKFFSLFRHLASCLNFKIYFIIIFLPNLSSSLKEISSCIRIYNHPSLFRGVLLGDFAKLRVRPKNKNTSFGPFDRENINISRQLEQEFTPCHLMLKGSKERKKQLPLQCARKKKKKRRNFEILKRCTWRDAANFLFLLTALKPNPR